MWFSVLNELYGGLYDVFGEILVGSLIKGGIDLTVHYFSNTFDKLDRMEVGLKWGTEERTFNGTNYWNFQDFTKKINFEVRNNG